MEDSLVQSDRLPRLWVVLPLLGVVFSFTPMSHAADVAPRPDAKLEGSDQAEPAPAPSERGMRIYLNENGTPIVPPAGTQEATVAPHVSNKASTKRRPLKETDAPGGGRMLILDDRFKAHSSARIAEDGSLSIRCERSDSGAHADADHPSCPPEEANSNNLALEPSHGADREAAHPIGSAGKELP